MSRCLSCVQDKERVPLAVCELNQVGQKSVGHLVRVRSIQHPVGWVTAQKSLLGCRQVKQKQARKIRQTRIGLIGKVLSKKDFAFNAFKSWNRVLFLLRWLTEQCHWS